MSLSKKLFASMLSQALKSNLLITKITNFLSSYISCYDMLNLMSACACVHAVYGLTTEFHLVPWHVACIILGHAVSLECPKMQFSVYAIMNIHVTV